MYKSFIRPLLFTLSPETAHHFTFRTIKIICFIPGVKWLISSLFSVKSKENEVKLWDLTFKNRVGLAAGFDKDAKLIDELACFGFGFIEVGTVTPEPQDGNPKPRMFRLPESQALINRMGFNNEGMEMMAKRLQERRSGIIVGGNIGKNKVTPNEEAVEDYKKCYVQLWDHVDYFVVNVSSPNTPGLRELQEKEPLMKLLSELRLLNYEISEGKSRQTKPLLLKIAPDLTETQLDDICSIALELPLDGIIATNTTIDRSSLKRTKEELEKIGAGGLSGMPVKQRSTEVVSYLYSKLGEKVPIIAVGGIFTKADADEKLKAGAKLVQVYTGFIYEGPGMVKQIING